MVSERVVNLLNENEITGWNNYPITLYDKKGNIVDGYYGFSVLGRGGKFSRLWNYGWNKETQKSFLASRGVYDISQWDGSDIFFVQNSWILITERVMKLMKSIKVTAVEYKKLSDDTDIIGESRFLTK